jgi:hypothetical protein
MVMPRNRITVNGLVKEQNAPKTRVGRRTVAQSDFAVATLLVRQLRQARKPRRLLDVSPLPHRWFWHGRASPSFRN